MAVILVQDVMVHVHGVTVEHREESNLSRTGCLQGDPGAGKSMMACLTAVNPPVHVLDIDRKILSAGWAEAALASGSVTVQELSEPIDPTALKYRLDTLANKITTEGPTTRPLGWTKFAELVYGLPKNEGAARAGTWVIDSLTLLNEHAKAHIMFLAKRTKYTFDQWTALKTIWMDTFSVMRDMAREHKKDLIVTVHERVKEEPGDRVTGARMEAVKSGDDITLQKTYVGTQDVKVWASIDGAFGDLIGAQCDEYYYLYVDSTNKDAPRWRCRIQPDGRRALRTSFLRREAVYDPDFRKIWLPK